VKLRNGLSGATTVWPALLRFADHAGNPDASAKLPCTSTIVGVVDVVMIVAPELVR
jgi:hypothetical protein